MQDLKKLREEKIERDLFSDYVNNMDAIKKIKFLDISFNNQQIYGADDHNYISKWHIMTHKQIYIFKIDTVTDPKDHIINFGLIKPPFTKKTQTVVVTSNSILLYDENILMQKFRTGFFVTASAFIY